MKIAAIVVNYRTAELTAAAVASLLPQLAAVGSFHVYVVDNCSGDDSVDVLRARAAAEGWGDGVTVVAAPRNGGYGYGINRAVEQARAAPSPADHYFILNSDAVADPGAVKAMVDFMDSHPGVGLCGGAIHGTDGAPQASAFRYPTASSELNVAAQTAVVARLLSNPVVALPLPAGPTAVQWISGTCLMIRRRAFDQIGFFDEGFFLYFEEVDYCRRARVAGWQAFCLPAATVTHLGSASTGMGDTSRPMPWYWFESRHRYLRKHHGRSYTVLCDVCWTSGFIVGEVKRRLLGRPPSSPRHMLLDFVRNSFRDLVNIKAAGHPDTAPPAGGGADARAPETLKPLELLAEDFATYGRDPFEPGFWAIATHRLGRLAETTRPVPAKLALEAGYRTLFTAIDWVWGIHLPRTVDVGRRVRLWHNGCMLLVARSIGNDVQIRHDTTFGPARGIAAAPDTLPIIEDRADIGSGACVLGGVHVGHDAVVGANSVVMKNVAPHTTVLGVPARIVPG